MFEITLNALVNKEMFIVLVIHTILCKISRLLQFHGSPRLMIRETE